MNSWFSSAYVLFTLDRLTKYIASSYFVAEDYPFTFFLNGTYLLNNGISFGLLTSEASFYFWILTGIILLATCLFGMCWFKQASTVTYASVGFFLITVGSASNIVDRLLYRGVIDWIHVHFYEYNFPVFNLADAYIVLGALLIFYSCIKE